jgi:cytochrome c
MFKLVLLSPALAIAALVWQQPAGPAQAGIPPEAKQMVNPVKPTPEGLTHAKKLYAMDCAICHGATGDGKGELAGDMKPPLKNFTDPAALNDFTDGELYYVIKNGKGQMMAEGDRTKPGDVWNLVLLVRSFAKK